MTQTRLPGQPPAGVPPGQTLDIAHFVNGMVTQLEAMANACGLEMLVYFLGMAKAESEGVH
jgi:hypothetical protein